MFRYLILILTLALAGCVTLPAPRASLTVSTTVDDIDVQACLEY